MLGKREGEDFERGGELNTLIGKGSTIEGTLKVPSSIRIDGLIRGKIAATEALVIGKEGDVEGEVRAKNVVVGGKMAGKIFASGKVVLEARAVYHGDIKTSKIVINDGAVFEGTCSMSDDGKVLALPSVNADRQLHKDAKQREEVPASR